MLTEQSVSHSTGSSSGAEVRLAGSGSSANQGRVEVYANGQWGTVCDDLFGQKDANVVCRQLGFPGASGYTKAQTFGAGSGPILMDNTRCVGNETSIMDCLTNPIGVHNCQHSDDVGVICRVAQGSSRGAEVRLAGSGSSANQGRVEVYINEQWGTVCDNLWGINDADVVCRQLGFPGASGVTRDAKTFGAAETTGSISPNFGCGRYAAMTLAVLPANNGRFHSADGPSQRPVDWLSTVCVGQ
eukprot:XP_011664396.1 PREDICTED: neurotrypsin [Strongylocentrotus purpuratus]